MFLFFYSFDVGGMSFAFIWLDRGCCGVLDELISLTFVEALVVPVDLASRRTDILAARPYRLNVDLLCCIAALDVVSSISILSCYATTF